MRSTTAYYGLVAAVGVERLVELVVDRRNRRWAAEQGGVETGVGHYPAMVALHTGLLAGCVLEVSRARRPFVPAVGWPAVAGVVAAQGLRWWCIRTLGRQWSTRIVVIPGAQRVTSGPYRVIPHPNYVAVATEGVALPLAHSAGVTATVFTVLNAVLLRHRIRLEDEALRSLRPGTAAEEETPERS
ncbi:hypothetical protein AWH69_11785 [Janibacter melonis]|uniref:Isoprenylcysteine carboxyl methyltransferase n=1 Tax=Janibacter melonis TaxID=262209 RepID=A0A176QBC5_9MICO|nr:isoprenylcysteine carboxyl methyltransferase family protein [Janibacter melonis]OAB87051.1 hypothetical protein AWH69_11785 [Janibacter melonis]